MKGKTKTERHHWWPEGVSRNWTGEDGTIHWMLPDGTVRKSTPKNFGVITNGHYIKLHNERGKETPWDQNFEPLFDKADGQFPYVIGWLQSLKREKRPDAKTLTERFVALEASDSQIAPLIECILSLAARSPLARDAAAAPAEFLRGGNLPGLERTSIVTITIRDSLWRAIGECGTRGKLAVLFSPDREFIFGDGFPSNFKAPIQYGYNPRLLVPITPEISVLYVRPMQYQEQPRLCTLVVTAEEARHLNDAVQIYAKEAIFYRSEAPELTEAYQSGQRRIFADEKNAIDQLMKALPGVITRHWPF